MSISMPILHSIWLGWEMVLLLLLVLRWRILSFYLGQSPDINHDLSWFINHDLSFHAASMLVFGNFKCVPNSGSNRCDHCIDLVIQKTLFQYYYTIAGENKRHSMSLSFIVNQRWKKIYTDFLSGHVNH